ncbi:hypothetical protein FQR65_LT17334 [Abscondita terminalis]|nr:hypothetical protein FQR65_LT17334 [Abscondita terminalis]
MDSKLSEDQRIDAIVKAMTNEDKANFLIGTGMPGLGALLGPVGDVKEGKVPGSAGGTFPMPKFGLPAVIVADGPAGVRMKSSKSTHCFQWNTALLDRLGKAMEMKNPLNGRNFEYYSEDPLVSGKIAAAIVNGIQSKGVGTSVKHYAANNQEANRLEVNAHISERAMREIYLRGFEIVVKESDPWTVMSAYNKINVYKQYKYSDKPALEQNALVTRNAATEGMVLLKNDKNTLPYPESSGNMALFGVTSYALITGGTGSGGVNNKHTVSLLEGLTNAGYKLNENLISVYKSTVEKEAEAAMKKRKAAGILGLSERMKEIELSDDIINKQSENSDIAVVTIGRNSGESVDRVLDNDFNLAADEIRLLDKYEDTPSAENFPGTPAKMPTDVTYREGIYVGYRYFDTFKVAPSYEFGYGKSYTTFGYSEIKADKKSFDKELTISAKITNTGKAAGKEVVQLYLSAPSKTVDKPSHELKAFAKTRELKPGEIQSLGLHHAGNYLFQNVNFTIKKNDKIGLVEGMFPDWGIALHRFLKQDLDFVKGRTVWNETMQAFESINAMKTELEEVNVGLATRTDYESDDYAKLIDRMTELNDLLVHHDAYNLDAEMEKNQEEVLSPNKTVLEEAEDAATEETRPRVRDLLGSFLFQGEDVQKKTKVLSGDKIFEFRDGNMKEYLGNIDEYLEYRQKESIREVSIEKSKLAEAKQEVPAPKVKEEPKTVESKKEFVSKEKKNIQNKISKTEQKINELESQIEEMEQGFAKENPTEEQLEKYQKLKEDA